MTKYDIVIVLTVRWVHLVLGSMKKSGKNGPRSPQNVV